MEVLIVADEQSVRKKINELLEQKEQEFYIREAASGQEALSRIEEIVPDILFLNINLKDISGFEIAGKLNQKRKRTVIIFISPKENHAVKAFDHNGHDFLLEPFQEKRFFKSLDKALSIKEYYNLDSIEKRLDQFLSKGRQEQPPLDNLPVKLGNKTYFIKVEDIKYIVADRYYAEIHTKKKKYVIRESLTRLISSIKSSEFFRIHRSYIININFIEEVIHADNSEMDIKMNDGKLLHVSRSHKRSLVQKLGI